MKTKILALLGIVLLTLAISPVAAQDNVPAVMVADQVSLNGSANVPLVVSDGPGWLVIHIDNDGAPGAVIGATQVSDGENSNVRVGIDVSQATPVLYAMLHTDDNEMGEYEFGTVEGADAPVSVDGEVVVLPFTSHVMSVGAQIVHDTFTAGNIVTDAPGWLALHQDVDGEPGPVIGFAPLQAGNNANVTVTVDGEVTERLFPMIHVDTGAEGTYEFGTVEGADSPVVVDGVVAVTGVSTAPAIVANPQIVVHAENFDTVGEDTATPTFIVASALSDGPGWIAVHSDSEGSPGPVAGFAAVDDGLNTGIVVELDPELVTTVLWPMLHTDDGEVGVYEFGTVEGADAPATAGGNVVVVPVNVAPNFSVAAQAISETGTITIARAVIDANGWLAIHSSVDGGPGPVIGVAPLRAGVNNNVTVEIDMSAVEGAATDQVFPMLHYDTGEAGVYEFGTVEGVDGPVVFGGGPLVGPLEIQ